MRTPRRASLLNLIALSVFLFLPKSIAMSAFPQSVDMLERSATFQDWKVAYSTRGEGESLVVLVHGWGADRNSWSRQLTDLNFGGRVVAIDLLGHGKSDKPEIDYTLDVLAGSALAVLDEFDAQHIVLVGHSAGVPVCRELLRRLPNRARGLVVVDGPLRSVMPDSLAKAMMQRLESPAYRDILQQMREFVKPQGELTQEQIDAVVAAAVGTPHHVLLSSQQAQLKEGYWRDDKIEVPLLAIYANNPMMSLWTEDYEAFVKALADDVDYYTWNETSHLLHLERAKEFNKLVETFAEGCIANEQ